MRCKECSGKKWALVWARVLIEEGMEVNMYQCKKCKRVVMASKAYAENPNMVA